MDKETLTLYFRFFNEIGIISQLSRALMDARLPGEMTTAHFTILNHLIRVGDGRTPLEMAKAFQLPKTTLTHMLKGVEKRGFVEIRPNPKDARSKQVWLTDKGIKFRDSSVASLVPEIGKLATELKGEDLGPLVEQLSQVRILMDKARDNED